MRDVNWIGMSILSEKEWCDACAAAGEGNAAGLELILASASAARGCSVASLDLLPREGGPSPLLLAGRHGCVEVLVLLLNTFPTHDFVNQTGTVVFPSSELHRCSALNAAAIGGHREAVALLLQRGASTAISDCLLCAPLCEAVYHNRPQVARCLLGHGADVNATNTFGFSPLHVAVVTGTKELVDLLLRSGADIHQAAPEGCTALHLAASSGHREVVKCLLDHGAPPLFPVPSEPPCPPEDYTPCPLFMAASKGHLSVVRELLRLPCPASCAADAWLLLGVTGAERGSWSQFRTNCSKALSLHGSGHPTLYVQPTTSVVRGTRKEVTQEDELRQLGSMLELLYQCLLVRERCLGSCDQQMVATLTKTAEEAAVCGEFSECEWLLFEAMRLMESNGVPALEKGIMLPQNFEVTVVEWVQEHLAALLVMAVGSGFTPHFSKYVNSVLRLEEAIIHRLEVIQKTFGCKREGGVALMEVILLLFQVWLYHNSQEEAKSGPELDDLGRLFVSKHLFLPGASTLLHLAIQPHDSFSHVSSPNSVIMAKLRPYVFWSHRATSLVNCLLQWGGRQALNRHVPPHGNRPLHLAAQQPANRELVTLLLSHGAHPDAVNWKGETPCHLLHQQASPETWSLITPPSPPPLACQAACVILDSGMDYHSLSLLPPLLKEFIKLHDPRIT